MRKWNPWVVVDNRWHLWRPSQRLHWEWYSYISINQLQMTVHLINRFMRLQWSIPHLSPVTSYVVIFAIELRLCRTFLPWFVLNALYKSFFANLLQPAVPQYWFIAGFLLIKNMLLRTWGSVQIPNRFVSVCSAFQLERLFIFTGPVYFPNFRRRISFGVHT